MARSLFLLLLVSLGLGQELCAQDTVEILRDQQRDFHASPPSAPWWEWDAATGNWLTLRPALQNKGVELFGGYTYVLQSAVNSSGPGESGLIYSGLLDFGVHLDLEKLVGWPGASVQTTWLWISGNSLNESLNQNFLITSDLAGFNTFRALDLWFQQNLLDDKISLRVGQFTADSEFVRSDYASLFLDRTFGWPAFLSANLPGGGPSVPLATIGARLALKPVDWLTFQSAVFQGNVYDQYTNPYGFRWRLNAENGLLFLNEAQFRWNHRDTETGLPGQFKAGSWIQTGHLADPLAGSTNSGNYGGYLILDQMLYRATTVGGAGDGKSPPEPKSNHGLGWFGQIGWAAQDRNVVGFYFDTGVTYLGLIPTRDHDTVGFGFAYGQLSSAASDLPTFRDSYGDGEQMRLEWTYQAQVTPWMVIQPDLQYIVSPGSALNFDNALVIGGSVSVRF